MECIAELQLYLGIYRKEYLNYEKENSTFLKILSVDFKPWYNLNPLRTREQFCFPKEDVPELSMVGLKNKD